MRLSQSIVRKKSSMNLPCIHLPDSTILNVIFKRNLTLLLAIKIKFDWNGMVKTCIRRDSPRWMTPPTLIIVIMIMLSSKGILRSLFNYHHLVSIQIIRIRFLTDNQSLISFLFLAVCWMIAVEELLLHEVFKEFISGFKNNETINYYSIYCFHFLLYFNQLI